MLAGARTWSNAVKTTCAEVAQTLSNAIDYEDADSSISCYGCETGSGKAISKAVAERSKPGEAAINLLQYVLSNG